ncbi:MAG: NAD+ synthase [Gammaproteobacteria bacterium]|nr:NAD+ synthase [Gammaproteobacteria bacterium]NNF62161.1 NAD+ synthase [Gammaproteobacteria bacterium]NNM21852.1 NAD+ synthase [Gammaproteobacteria bacterium]
MAKTIRFALAQLDFTVGDVDGNAERVLAACATARDELDADVIVFPELTLTGYPPEDLLFHAGLRYRVEKALQRVCNEITGITALVGYPEFDGHIYNTIALMRDGESIATYRKQILPNYGVFDEKRYFRPGQQTCVLPVHGCPVALTICEDIWEPGPVAGARAAGAKLVLNPTASPYAIDKQERREQVMRARVAESGLSIIYVNHVGGQDELVFDGVSTAIDSNGDIVLRAPACKDGIYLVEADPQSGRLSAAPGSVHSPDPLDKSVYDAIVLGVRDYVRKNGFPGVIIGLSGGIDSALTLAIASDALGPERVRGVLMPSRYTANMSIEDARAEAEALGVEHHLISIEPMFEATLGSLQELFAGLPADSTEENIQARCRGIILMAISNKTGRMVLTTGNKSEMAVGYATLYGDMAGGFAPIKDCSKTLVYRLARYRNSVSAVIPERVFTRPPSAELAPDQKDTDSLPPYDVLDAILEAFIEEDCSVEQIAARGYDRETVVRVLHMVKRNEYKRRQAPPGVRVSRRGFGRDWRYPITSGY